MLPTLFQIISIVADIVLFIFVGIYLLSLRKTQKELETKQNQVDANNHQIAADALTKEQKVLQEATNESSQILQVATQQADQIISGAQYISQASKQSIDQALQQLVQEVQGISQTAKVTVDQTVRKMAIDMQQQSLGTAHDFSNNYVASLKQLSTESLNDFQLVAKELEVDLQKQIKEFRETLLPNLEKEVEAYKQSRLKQTEQTVARIVQKVSQDILNKSLSLEDHQNLLIESLEKAKKEGIFS